MQEYSVIYSITSPFGIKFKECLIYIIHLTLQVIVVWTFHFFLLFMNECGWFVIIASRLVMHPYVKVCQLTEFLQNDRLCLISSFHIK